MATENIDYKSIIELDSEFNTIQDMDILLERILLEARKVVNADAGSIYIKQVSTDEDIIVEKLSIKYAHNDTIQQSLPPGQKMIYSVFSVPINQKSISGYCAFTMKMVNVPDMYNIPASAPYSFHATFDQITGYKTISTLTFPLATAEGRLLGVIQLINKKDDNGNVVSFSGDDEFLITHFAVNATIALQRAYAVRTMILRMIKMSELRDPKETGSHVNRVAGYAVDVYDRLAAKTNVPPKEREYFRDILRVASMLHDVGKVAISDTILKKPGRFTPEEFKVMQHHPLYGSGLFDDLQSPTDVLARDIALNHHENWDGTGYPHGIQGSDIPLAGRIVAIVDVYDALCSKRVYKEPWDEEQVLTTMREMTGTKFEPELVDIFFEVLPNIKQTQTLYPEEEEGKS